MTTALVIHAKHLTDRLRYMQQQLKGWKGEVRYIEDYDKSELTEELLAEWFKPGCELYNISGPTSCAMKHLEACRIIVDEGLEGAVVFEDDIMLHRDFSERLDESLKECRERFKGQPVIISYEDSSLQFIPRSQRVGGRLLYEAPHGRNRCNGALYVSREAALAICREVETHRCDISIDHYYQIHLYDKGIVKMLWCEPCLATQGSFCGGFVSSMGQIRQMEGLRWKLKYAYKRLLYWLR